MKRPLFYAFALLSLAGSAALAQTLYVPSGSVGTSSNGNVGIGTSSPVAALQVGTNIGNQGFKVGVNSNAANSNAEVLGNIAAVGFDANNISSSGAVAWNFYNAGNSPSWSGTLLQYFGTGMTGNSYGLPQSNLGALVFQNEANGVIATNGTSPIYISPGSTPAAVFMPGGNVGIGTVSPATKLHVKDGQIRVDCNTYARVEYAASGALQWSVGTRNTNDYYIYRESGTTNVLIPSGNVGIGTTNPQSPLSVSGQLVVGDPYQGDASLNVTKSYGGFGRLTQIYPGTGANLDALNLMGATDANGNYSWWAWGIHGDSWTINPGTNFGVGLTMTTSGNVGVGTTNPGTYKLAVNGTIHTKEVVVDTNGWSDYVFKPDYRLASLHEVQQTIEKEGHLPGIPSAKEVAEHGIGLGDMQAKLLAKIEELTLHQIAQEKREEGFARRIDQLERENAALRSALGTAQKK